MTNVYDVGDQALLATTVTVNGTPTDATMALTVTAPDGTTSTPSMNHPSVGNWNATVPVTGAGLWLYRWVASGAAVGVDEGQFTARPAGLRIVSLGEAKTHLNKSSAGTADDEELRGFIDAAGAIIKELAGPVLPETVTEYHDGGASQIVLRAWPVLSVTTLTETWRGGTAYTLTLEPEPGPGGSYDYTLDVASGIITRRINGLTTAFACGTRNIKAVYQAGRSGVPANVRLATLELVGHLWRTSQLGRGGNRASTGGDDTLTLVLGYAIPNRVIEMLGTDRATPLVG